MSWSFSILDDEALHNDMATPIAENADGSEIPITSPIDENAERCGISVPSPVAENIESAEISITSPIAENAESSEISITYPIAETAKHLEVSPTSPVAENTEHSEISTSSSETVKPENYPSLMTNPIVQGFNTSIDSKAINETESEGDAEFATALAMDGLKISNEIVAYVSNAEAIELEDPGTVQTIEELANDVQDIVVRGVRKLFLPAEIRKKIFKIAMTAEGAKFEFTDRVGPFKPNVATGLLSANREFYHDAREYLHSENNFVFLGCGPELRTILGQQHGLWSCKMDGCKSAGKGPRFGKVTIVLGDDVSMAVAELKLQCTRAALESIRGECSIEMLHILFKGFCWVAGHGPVELGWGLSRLKVGALGMFGAEFHWHEDLRLIPLALGLERCPAYLGIANGFFECGYLPAVPAGHVEEVEVVGEETSSTSV